jgi:spoIIIJ-associated protein
MEWVEMTGRTVDEAKDLALDRLGVDEADAEFEVVEEPRPGLFGRVRGEARVRARVRPTQPRAKVERRDRRRRTSGSSQDGAGRADASAPQQANAEDDVSDEETQDAVEAAPKRAARSADTGALASQFLLGLAEAFGTRGTTEVLDVGDGDVEVRLQGDDLGLLIGPRGQTLQAVQDLTRVAVQRQEEDRHGRLRIDIAGYRERRREALGRFTEQVVAEVVASGQARALEPMSSPDRKVVHDVASAAAGVTTRSEGDEAFRRVVILPADA